MPNHRDRFPTLVGVQIAGEYANVRRREPSTGERILRDETGILSEKIIELTTYTRPDDTFAQIEFTLPMEPEAPYQVSTGGWQSWSTSTFSKGLFALDNTVGPRRLHDALGLKTLPYIEPLSNTEDLHINEGRSYGIVNFRNMRSGENTFLGVIPSLETVEDIRYRVDGQQIIISVRKHLDKVEQEKERMFRIYLGQGNPRGSKGESLDDVNVHPGSYVDLLLAFNRELSGLPKNIPLMQNRIIGFSWAAFGPGVTQEKVTGELNAGKGVIDTYIMDDGAFAPGSFMEIDRKKFPDVEQLTAQAKESGISPGIWINPFIVRSQDLHAVPPEYLMKDEGGNPMQLPTSILSSTGHPLRPTQKPFGIDISRQEARQLIVDKVVRLAEQGFDVFKADFLSGPLLGHLQNKDKTPVEYYRLAFEEIRAGVRQKIGKEIEIIGCGAPMMESIGLFNAMRFTSDTALPNMEELPTYGEIISLANKLGIVDRFFSKSKNTEAYKIAASTAARRALLFRGVHGLILDGVHIADPKIVADTKIRGAINQVFLTLHTLGIDNITIGDSLVRLGTDGIYQLQEYITQFKEGGPKRNLRIQEK